MRTNKPIRALAGAAALSLALGAGSALAQMTDEEIAAQIQQEIQANPELSEVQIDVVAEDGTIKLTGMVDELEQLNAIEEIIEGMEGADSVENNVVMQ